MLANQGQTSSVRLQSFHFGPEKRHKRGRPVRFGASRFIEAPRGHFIITQSTQPASFQHLTITTTFPKTENKASVGEAAGAKPGLFVLGPTHPARSRSTRSHDGRRHQGTKRTEPLVCYRSAVTFCNMS